MYSSKRSSTARMHLLSLSSISFILWMSLLIQPTSSFRHSLHNFPSILQRQQQQQQHHHHHNSWTLPPLLNAKSVSSTVLSLARQQQQQTCNTSDFNQDIRQLLSKNGTIVLDVINFLDETEQQIIDGKFEPSMLNEESYLILLRNCWGQLNKKNKSHTKTTRVVETAESIFQKLQYYRKDQMTARSYNSLLSIWAYAALMIPRGKRAPPPPTTATKHPKKSSTIHLHMAGTRCSELLDDFWKNYSKRSNKDIDRRPNRSSYVSAMTAWSRCGGGKEAAEETEQLLEEMENLRNQYPDLSPTTLCVNVVLNAWSRSGFRGAAPRAETILKRMENLSLDSGRMELMPNTTSYNTVIHAFAQSKDRGSAHKTEELLYRMNELSNSGQNTDMVDGGQGGEGGGLVMAVDWCQPDERSYNTVLNAWAREGAARRAESILRHMEKRFESGQTHLQPDVTSYTTVLKAWAKSHDSDAAQRAEQLVRRMEKNGNLTSDNNPIHPNSLTYNTLIDVLSKSRVAAPIAVESAMATLSKMKTLSTQMNRPDCAPDIFTYTSVVNTLVKLESKEGADRAIALLEEVEDLYKRTQKEQLRPNVQTYTSVINAIGRSKVHPEKALAIVERLEQHGGADPTIQVDVICYNALLNAYGWSNDPHRAQQCFDIYNKMLMQKNGKNAFVKPDLITCNSILNAFAFAPAETEVERSKIVSHAIQVMETLQSRALGCYPNHNTYANLLGVIGKHVTNHAKIALAETTFWQCCQQGALSPWVVHALSQAVPWETFAKCMGDALLSSSPDEPLRFDLTVLPRKWTRFSPSSPKKSRRSHHSRPSRKQSVVEVTKSTLRKGV